MSLNLEGVLIVLLAIGGTWLLGGPRWAGVAALALALVLAFARRKPKAEA